MAPAQVAHYDHLADFNRSDNAHGEKYMVLLLAAEEGESIELKCARWALFLDAAWTKDMHVMLVACRKANFEFDKKDYIGLQIQSNRTCCVGKSWG